MIALVFFLCICYTGNTPQNRCRNAMAVRLAAGESGVILALEGSEMKRKILLSLMTITCTACLFLLTACGGSSIEIGENGHWYVDGKDTGVVAEGQDGSSIAIGSNGHWYIDGVDTGMAATVPEGSKVEIGENGNWMIDGVDTGIPAAGEDGSEVTIGSNGHWYIDGVDSGFSVTGGDYNPQGLDFCPLDDGTYAVSVGNARYLRSVVIPAEFNGKTVTVVGAEGFAESTLLQSITLPESIVRIDAGAFRGCTALEEIVIPSTLVSIGESTFSGCISLKEVVLTKNVVQVGAYAFQGCESLRQVQFMDTTNWYVCTSADGEGATAVSGMELQSGLIAAEMMINTRCAYYWIKNLAVQQPGV